MDSSRIFWFAVVMGVLVVGAVGYATGPAVVDDVLGVYNFPWINATVGVYGPRVVADEYFLDTVNKTDIFKYPQQPASYIVWTDGTTYYAKNGTDASVTSNTNETTLLTDTIAHGGTIVIQPGTYTKDTASPISIPSDTTIYFEGATIALASGINEDAVIFTNENGYDGDSNIKLIGGTFDLEATGNTGRQFAYSFHNVTNLIVEAEYADYDYIPYMLLDCVNGDIQPNFDYQSESFFYNDFEAAVSKVTLDGGNPFGITPRTFGSVWEEAGTYYLYTGTGNIYLYNSTDRVNWVEEDDSPVVLNGGAGTWDDVNIYCPMVWKEGATYYMIYGGYDATGECKVGLATAAAPEGPWTKEATNPVFTNTDTVWGPGAEPWGIIKIGSTYYLWFNNYGNGHGVLRTTGLATSTDLTTWTPDVNNPLFTQDRYCPWVFKFGGSYYLIVTMQYEGDDYADFELYRDNNPTFYPNEREYLGNLFMTNRDLDSWDGDDIDTPCIEMNDIDQDYGVSPTTLRFYYSGANATSSNWDMGYGTINTNDLMKLERVYADYTSANDDSTAFSISGDTSKTGSNSLLISTSAAHESLCYPVNKMQGTEQFWFNQTGKVTLFVYMRGPENEDLGFFELYGSGATSKIQYTQGTTTTASGYATTANVWYQLTMKWDSNMGKYGYIVKDSNGHVVISRVNLDMKENGKIVKNIQLYRNAGSTGTIYIDDLYGDYDVGLNK